MKYEEAFSIVLELAQQNALDADTDEVLNDQALFDEALRQDNAIKTVLSYVQNHLAKWRR